MFYWLRVAGGTTLRKYDWDPGPWPKEDAQTLKTQILSQHPNLAVGIEPAWEGPFEDMIRAKAGIYRFGKPSGHRWVFVYRATEDRLFVFQGNLRVGTTFHRVGDSWTLGQEIGVGHEVSYKFDKETLEEIERQLLAKSPTGCWDSGWSPASPDR